MAFFDTITIPVPTFINLCHHLISHPLSCCLLLIPISGCPFPHLPYHVCFSSMYPTCYIQRFCLAMPKPQVIHHDRHAVSGERGAVPLKSLEEYEVTRSGGSVRGGACPRAFMDQSITTGPCSTSSFPSENPLVYNWNRHSFLHHALHLSRCLLSPGSFVSLSGSFRQRRDRLIDFGESESGGKCSSSTSQTKVTKFKWAE